MGSAAAALTLLLLLANVSRFGFIATPPHSQVLLTPTEAKAQPPDPEENINYRVLEPQRPPVERELSTFEGGNGGDRVIPLPGHRRAKSSRAVLHDGSHSPGGLAVTPAGRAAGGSAQGFLRQFVRAHQVLSYVVCTFVLAGFALVFTLVIVCRDQRRLSWVEDDSWQQFDESYPLLDRYPLPAEGGSASVEEHGTADDVEANRAVPHSADDEEDPTKLRNELDDDPAQVVPNTKRAAKRPIEVFPGRLLDLCNQCAPLTFLAFLPDGSQERSKWLAHGRHSEVFQVASLVKRTVLKIMPIIGEFSEQQVDTIAGAIECCFTLNSLRHGTRYKTSNFTEVERIACVFDQFPGWLLRSDRGLGSKESLAESLASETADAGSPGAADLLTAFRRWKGTNQCCLTRHFIVFEQRYAGKPLSRITLGSAVQGRSLLLQAACCVAVAERALGFRHTGVDCDKLLVAVTDEASLEYRVPDRAPLSVDCAGLKAHLAGAMSFAFDGESKEDDDFAYREKATGSPSSDCSGHGAPHFYGNVMWLSSVLDCVVHKLSSEVPVPRARTERAVFEELRSWQARLQQCNSAAEFAAALGL